MTEATIYDVSRLCKAAGNCDKCVLGENNNGRDVPCESLIIAYPDDANEIIIGWCEDNPPKTRQSEFLKLFPNASMTDGFIDICPKNIDKKFICIDEKKCEKCFKEYWAEEVEG